MIKPALKPVRFALKSALQRGFVVAAGLATLCGVEAREVSVMVDFSRESGPMQMERFTSLSAGGMSEKPFWSNRVPEIRVLRPKFIRIFLQEFFNPLPARGKYRFELMDKAVAPILETGAEPIMCIAFKPKVLFPEINQAIVEPNDWREWDRLIFAMVKHFRDRGAGIRYWEISNEPDFGETGGCPYLFNATNYFTYYKRTVAAILRADPSARVGGPALADVRSPILPALLECCETERVPIHFVSWHNYSNDPLGIRGTAEHALKAIAKHPSLKVETILDEWNMDLFKPPADPQFQPCFACETIWQLRDAGVDATAWFHIRDYTVEYTTFTNFFSLKNTAMMVNWWGRMPQYDAFFDYQDTVRPSYFAFRLLARMGGERVAVETSDGKVHGFATVDRTMGLRNLMLWNFSEEPATLNITLNGLGKRKFRAMTLDARTANNDDNARMRPDPIGWHEEEKPLREEFGAYGVKYWYFE